MLPSYLAMAGNIIPAIATTNAVIAGLIVLEALKILNSDFDQCRTVNLRCYSFDALKPELHHILSNLTHLSICFSHLV